jgi:hypothetical protein
MTPLRISKPIKSEKKKEKRIECILFDFFLEK